MINDTCFYYFFLQVFPTYYNRQILTNTLCQCPGSEFITKSFMPIEILRKVAKISDILFTKRTGAGRVKSSGQTQRVEDVATECSSCSTLKLKITVNISNIITIRKLAKSLDLCRGF